MTCRRKVLCHLAGAVLAATACLLPSDAPAWPDRVVRIMTGPAGSSGDAVARTLADALSDRWKQPVIVENRAGADHILAAQAMLQARDGHTLLFTPQSTLTVNPLLHGTLPYDPEKDFAPISLAAEDFLCLAAAPALGVTSLDDLVKRAAVKPGELNFYAVPGAPHLSWLAFQKRTGISTTFVPYRTPMGAVADLSEGRIHIALIPYTVVRGQAEANKITVLAITNATRAIAAPDTPTVAEAGYPDLTFGGFLGLFGPRDMPTPLQERLSQEVREILLEPEAQKRLANLGLLARGTTPAEFRLLIEEQRTKWAALARAHDIKPSRQ